MNTLYRQLIMTWRQAKRMKLFSLINLFGLTIGITCCIMILLYVNDELQYDKNHLKADQIVLLQQFEGSYTTGGKLGPELDKRFAQIEQTARLKNSFPLISYKDISFYEQQFYFSDSTILNILSIDLVNRSTNNVFAENNGVIISEKIANKYFAGENPLGKQLRYDGNKLLLITGVFKNLPSNSHIHPDFLANYRIANDFTGYDVTDNYWGPGSLTYLLLAPGTDPAGIKSQFPEYIRSLNDANASGIWKLDMIPLKDLYLRTSYLSNKPITYVYIFSAAALFVMLLACFNYINLSTARANSRTKEVGLRKVLGSSIPQLRIQFMLETIAFVTASTITAILLVVLLLPEFNNFSGKELRIDNLLTINNFLIASLFILTLSTIAGIYPAFVLSSFNPAHVLKGGLYQGPRRIIFRRTLIGTQFFISIIMILATIIVFSQLKYINNKKLGYNRAGIITLDLKGSEVNSKLLFKQKVMQLSPVISATIAYGLPGSNVLQGQKLVSDYVPKDAINSSIMRLTADEDYLKTFNIVLKSGRLLDPARPADREAFLINESAKKYFGWEDISGKMTGYYTFRYKADGSYSEIPIRGEVVGVIEDYHHANLKSSIEPMIISLNEGNESQMAILCRTGNIGLAIEQVRGIWKKIFPGKPFDYVLMEDQFIKTYSEEYKTGKVFALFAILTIIISCLGIIGLITYAAERRKKEIGIRKLLGASILGIFKLLSLEYIALIGVSSAIAIPLAAIGMKYWLSTFSYRIEIGLHVYFFASVTLVIISLILVAIQATKVALANPVNSLRTE